MSTVLRMWGNTARSKCIWFQFWLWHLNYVLELFQTIHYNLKTENKPIQSSTWGQWLMTPVAWHRSRFHASPLSMLQILSPTASQSNLQTKTGPPTKIYRACLRKRGRREEKGTSPRARKPLWLSVEACHD